MTDHTDCESRGDCDNTREDLAEAHAEIARLRAALTECAADFATNPGTVMSAQIEINREFQRRMEVAHNALNNAGSEDRP